MCRVCHSPVRHPLPGRAKALHPECVANPPASQHLKHSVKHVQLVMELEDKLEEHTEAANRDWNQCLTCCARTFKDPNLCGAHTCPIFYSRKVKQQTVKHDQDALAHLRDSVLDPATHREIQRLKQLELV